MASRPPKRRSVSTGRGRATSQSENRLENSNNPTKLTIGQLIHRLNAVHIKASASLGRAALLQLYKDNCDPESDPVDTATSARTDRAPQQGATQPNMAEVMAQLRALEAAVANIHRQTADQQPPSLQSDSTEFTLATADASLGSPAAGHIPNAQCVTDATAARPQPGRAAPMDSLPPVDVVSLRLRQDIISGKHINLASLLLPGIDSPTIETNVVDQEGTQTVVKSNDPRLHRNLSITEFRKAFSKFKNVICEAYPHRRKELDMYSDLIDDLHQKYGGHGFYDYHNAFSRKAAQYLHQHNILVDWAHRDTALFLTLFSGKRVETCAECGSALHTTNFCIPAYSKVTNTRGFNRPPPRQAAAGYSDTDRRGRSIVFHSGKQLCNNFNENSCTRPSCNLLHLCKACKAPHSIMDCPTKKDANQDKTKKM